LFILFTAEEKGLLGSRYYVDNPIFPLEKTIALLNMDMISRNNVDQLAIVGKYQYPHLYKIVDDINKNTVNFEINFNLGTVIRNSDHFPFMRKNIPSLFFNSGEHDDLHTPRDTPGLIDVEKTEKAAQLVFLTLWKIAELPASAQGQLKLKK
jgi:Zn-dependent M28 family amino/carboxypeptidase